jgi:hypothetical protein
VGTGALTFLGLVGPLHLETIRRSSGRVGA